MAKKFLREYELIIVKPQKVTDSEGVISDADVSEGLKFTDLRVRFEVTKDLFGFPNLAKIDIYNLSEGSINKATERGARVILSAGYKDLKGLIFKGEIKNIITTREGVDKVTTIYSGDGERKISESRTSRTYDKGVSPKKIIEDIAGLDMNIATASIQGLDNIKQITGGLSFNSDSKIILDKMAKAYGFNWSIQDGVFVVIPKDKHNEKVEAVLIDANTGMIGSPSITEIGADVSTLMNSTILPNNLIKIESNVSSLSAGNLYHLDRKRTRTIGNGFFKVNKVTHKGDSRGAEWMSIITGRRVKLI